jgi:hypothetical protein
VSLSPPSVASVQKAAPAANSDKLTYVYLTSIQHSGSTLIAFLLGAHPEIATVGEFGSVFRPEWFSRIKCSCGEPLFECSFWKTWQDDAKRAGLDFKPGAMGVNVFEPEYSTSFFDKLLVHYSPHRAIDRIRDAAYVCLRSRRRKFAAAADRSVRLARLLCQRQQAQAFLDTTKPVQQIRVLGRHPQIDLKVISLIRDGRAVMKSLIEKEGYSPEKAVYDIHWGIRYQLRAEATLPPERLYRLRLEDLCADPTVVLRELRSFIGVAPDPLGCDSTQGHHIIGNGMRMRYDGVIRYDQSWKTELSPQHLALFEARAGRINRSLGYED